MYAKIFSSMYQGTLRGNSRCLLVFTNILAHCDSAGVADIHPRAIAEETGLTVDEVRAALVELASPDPDSRSPEEEGRRITLLDAHRDWGWLVVNHAKYRAIRNAEDRREQNRIAQTKFRESKPSVSNSKHPSAESAHTDTETDTDTSKPTTLSGKPDVSAPAKELLNFLNEKAGRAYKPVSANLDFIKARLKEGYTPGEMRQVIAKKCREWAGDEKMADYLRPATLFNKTKLAQYTGELVIPKESHA